MVRRVLMGTETQLWDAYEDELKKFPQLHMWGIILERDHSLARLAEGSAPALPTPTFMGTLDSLAMPTDLSKPKSWTVKEFLSFAGDAEVS